MVTATTRGLGRAHVIFLLSPAQGCYDAAPAPGTPLFMSVSGGFLLASPSAISLLHPRCGCSLRAPFHLAAGSGSSLCDVCSGCLGWGHVPTRPRQEPDSLGSFLFRFLTQHPFLTCTVCEVNNYPLPVTAVLQKKKKMLYYVCLMWRYICCIGVLSDIRAGGPGWHWLLGTPGLSCAPGWPCNWCDGRASVRRNHTKATLSFLQPSLSSDALRISERETEFSTKEKGEDEMD